MVLNDTIEAALIGLFGAIVGGVLTAGGAMWQARAERRARRAKIASALLWELRTAEYFLHQSARDIDNLSARLSLPLVERLVQRYVTNV